MFVPIYKNFPQDIPEILPSQDEIWEEKLELGSL